MPSLERNSPYRSNRTSGAGEMCPRDTIRKARKFQAPPDGSRKRYERHSIGGWRRSRRNVRAALPGPARHGSPPAPQSEPITLSIHSLVHVSMSASLKTGRVQTSTDPGPGRRFARHAVLVLDLVRRRRAERGRRRNPHPIGANDIGDPFPERTISPRQRRAR